MSVPRDQPYSEVGVVREGVVDGVVVVVIVVVEVGMVGIIP